MAWIIGLANQQEIEAIEKAGYDAETNIKGIEFFAKSEEGDSIGIAVFVDCDVQDLLSVKNKEVDGSIIMLPDNELKWLITDAVINSLGYWAEIRNVKGDCDGIYEIEIRDREDQAAPYVLITLDKLKEAIRKIQSKQVRIASDIAAQFLGDTWNVDADGGDAVLQIAAYGEIVFG